MHSCFFYLSLLMIILDRMQNHGLPLSRNSYSNQLSSSNDSYRLKQSLQASSKKMKNNQFKTMGQKYFKILIYRPRVSPSAMNQYRQNMFSRNSLQGSRKLHLASHLLTSIIASLTQHDSQPLPSYNQHRSPSPSKRMHPGRLNNHS